MQRHRNENEAGASLPRSARGIREEPQPKLPELAACPDCGASYRAGRWTWRPAPVDAYPHRCPACERIATDYPAGVLHLEGRFAREHRDELLRQLRNIEQRERSDHPLKRIMAITTDDAGTTVTVTDAKLAESFGRALNRAFEGVLTLPPTTAERDDLVRVRWVRD